MYERILAKLLLFHLGCVCATLTCAQTSWTAIRSGTTSNLWGACYGGGQFVAVGENGTILTSPDGVAWTARASGTQVWLTAVAYGMGNYIAVGGDGVILVSYDGVIWQNATAREASAPTDRLNVVFFDGYEFLIYGEHSRSLTVTLPVRIDRLERSAQPDAPWWRAVARGHDYNVLGGETGLAVFRFGQAVAISVPANVRNISGTVLDGDAFVAVGTAGVIVTSADALTWTLVPSGTTVNLQAIATFNNTLVAVGERGTILSRDENGAWQRRSSPSDELLLGVAASGDAIVAVGGSGTILRSTPAPTAPRIISSPMSVTETLGGAASFTVRAAGSLPLTYQWYRDGLLLPGETRGELIRSPLTATDAGSYTVKVANSAGLTNSNPATLQLLPAPARIVDDSFQADASLDGRVQALLILPDGGLLVATNAELRGDGVLCRLRKLSADGALDPTWAGNTFGSTDSGFPSINTLMRQPDGMILVGGNFATHNNQPRPNLIRLNPSGTLDSTFAAATEATGGLISTLAVQPNGQVLVANNRTTPVRLLSNGSLDASFRPSAQPGARIPAFPTTLRDRLIQRLAVTADGKIYTAGVANLQFTNITGPIPDTRIERLNSDGSVDLTFSPLQWSGGEAALRGLDDGSLVVIQELSTAPNGTFSSRDGRVMRFRSDGSSFPQHAAPRISFPIAHYIYPDGRVLYAASQSGPIRLTALGMVDPNFTGGVGNPSALEVAVDGRVLVGGNFTLYNGSPANRIARLISVPNETVKAPMIFGLFADKTSVNVGETITLRAVATGSAELTYDWTGVTSSGTTLRTASPVLSFAYESASGLRDVQLTVRNNRGSSASESLRFTVVPKAPVVVEQPGKVSAQFGREVTLSISINSNDAGNCWFDWYRNGQPLDVSTQYDRHQYYWYLPKVTTAEAGIYTVVVRNAAGVAITSAPIELTIDDSSRFANLSTRAFLGVNDAPIIAGLVITGHQPRTVLVRGIGPALAKLGVSNALPDPQIALFDGTGHVQTFNSNDDWSGTALPPAFERTGAFPLDAGSKDAALIATLAPGNYTVQLSGKPGQSGSALVEIYEADNIADRMLNISTRASVTATAAAIAGFSIYGPVSKSVLIRAAGPALAALGVSNALANPKLELRDARGLPIAANDDWNATSLAPVMAAVGAFPFATGSRDAALLVTLAPGNYTVIVDGVGGTSGVVLAEIYEVP